MVYRFQDKVALITGSSSGIGQKIAIYLASLGCKLVITGRDEQTIKAVAQKCRQLSNQKVVEVKTDLLNDNEVQSLVKTTIDEFGKLDLLINSANISIACSITDLNIMQIYGNVFNTNVRSAVLLTSLVIPYLEKTKGSIIFLKSDSGLKPYESEMPFGVSEAALDVLSTTLAQELKSKEIKVLTINSALVMSPVFERNPWLSTTLCSRL